MKDTLLFQQVKRKLNITWDDEDTTERLKDIIGTAILDLKHRLGIVANDYDFSIAGIENTLFLAYCLYEWNHALNEFEGNYSGMIAMCRQKHEVENYQANEVLTDV